MKGSKDKCWNCDGRNMKAVETWFECQDCGATWVPPTKAGYNPFETEGGGMSGSKGTPSKSAVRAAATARKAKLNTQ